MQAAIDLASVPTETELNAQAVASIRRGPKNRLIVRGTVIEDDTSESDNDVQVWGVKVGRGDVSSRSLSRAPKKGLRSGMFVFVVLSPYGF